MPKSVDIKKLTKALDVAERAYMDAEAAYTEQEASASRRRGRTTKARRELETKYNLSPGGA